MSCKAATAKHRKRGKQGKTWLALNPVHVFGGMIFGWHVLCEILVVKLFHYHFV
jgi:hypothetical protein